VEGESEVALDVLPPVGARIRRDAAQR